MDNVKLSRSEFGNKTDEKIFADIQSEAGKISWDILGRSECCFLPKMVSRSYRTDFIERCVLTKKVTWNQRIYFIEKVGILESFTMTSQWVR